MSALRILSKTGTVEILELLSNMGKLRSADLSRVVKNPRTLSVRLMELADAGLIKREGKFYQITDQGGVALSLAMDVQVIFLVAPCHAWASLHEFPRVFERFSSL
ncbi:MAG: hypothetical protein AOA66_1055 [Candidatus Bathyarchaeota archaeon BA2]|nr:MAG: hypothetical protein AOA66_1055 [Candidatus Bathyarchaeota archaeon BA2]